MAEYRFAGMVVTDVCKYKQLQIVFYLVHPTYAIKYAAYLYIYGAL